MECQQYSTLNLIFIGDELNHSPYFTLMLVDEEEEESLVVTRTLEDLSHGLI